MGVGVAGKKKRVGQVRVGGWMGEGRQEATLCMHIRLIALDHLSGHFILEVQYKMAALGGWVWVRDMLASHPPYIMDGGQEGLEAVTSCLA